MLGVHGKHWRGPAVSYWFLPQWALDASANSGDVNRIPRPQIRNTPWCKRSSCKMPAFRQPSSEVPDNYCSCYVCVIIVSNSPTLGLLDATASDNLWIFVGNCKQNQGSIYRMCLRWTLMCACETRARERERERKRKNCSDTPYNSSLFAKFWRSPITLGFGGFCLVSFCFSQGCVVLSIHVAHQDIHVPMPEKLQAQHAKCNSSSSKQKKLIKLFAQVLWARCG